MRTPKEFAQAELSVHFRPPQNPIHLATEAEVIHLLRSIWDNNLMGLQEQLYVVYLNQGNHLVGWRCLHTGMITATMADIRLLFGLAFGCGATRMILAHNHPSGNLFCSQADLSLTSRIKEAGRLLDVELLDHIILTAEGSFSILNQRKINN